MTTITQIQNINAFVEAFITEHGSEDMVAMWQSEDIQSEFMKLAEQVKTKGKTKGSGKKDPNKPKRGKSAYLFFCADHRLDVNEQLGDDAKATEVTAELGRMWNELKESGKEADKQKLIRYENAAKADKERYLADMEGYEPPSDEELDAKPRGRGKGKKASGKKDPNKPKRGKSSYIFFCADHREEAKAQLGAEAKATEVTAELGRLWNTLKESDQEADKKKFAQYEKKAQEDKERYLAEQEAYENANGEESGETKKKTEEVVEEVIEEDDEETAQLKKMLQAKIKPKTSEKTSEKKTSEKKTSEKKTSEKKTSEKKTTGFSLFCKATRAEVKEENPDAKSADITKLLSGMWKDLTKGAQNEWKERAAQM